MKMKWFALAAMVIFLVTHETHAQCTSVDGVGVSVMPNAPLQFQFFPMSLLGFGSAGNPGSLSIPGAQQFGIQFTNNTGTEKTLILDIDIRNSAGTILDRHFRVQIVIPIGPSPFITVPQIVDGNIPSSFSPGTPTNARINDSFVSSLSGGLPSGSFFFDISLEGGSSTCMNTVTVEVLTGSTVDIIIPSNGAASGNLPLFQWAAVGGNEFRLTFAKLRPNQSFEDALATSSQRVVLDPLMVTSYQAAPGGPSGAMENNLTWNPGLQDGDYCAQVTMIQRDPLTGTTNQVKSAIHAFTVSSGTGGMTNTVGLNASEILNLLGSLPGGATILEALRGYNPVSIEINGAAATVEDLRNKLNSLPGTALISIKP